MKKKIFYWSPGFSKIATFKAVINSAQSIIKFDKKYDVSLINFFGEFNEYNLNIKNKEIELINYFNDKILKYLPKYGWFKSRLSFLFIFLLSFFPLKNILSKKKPEFIIIHLVSSLPLFLLIFFSFKTKFILRISGYPNLNIFRVFLWKLAFKKIHAVTCPTKLTKDKLLKLKIIDQDKLFVLYDPVLNINQINKMKRKELKVDNKKFFLAAGRLTKQKNFEFLIEAYNKFIVKSEKLLFIAGDGEEYQNLKKLILKKKLEKKVFLIGYKDNIYNYMKNCEAFILSSLWEDPGFVLIEAAFCRANIISSNCKNGPIEFIENNRCGFGFKNNSLEDFEKQFNIFLNSKKEFLIQKKINALTKIKKFTNFTHFKELNKILDKI